LLGRGDLGLELVGVRSEVELVEGVRVVAGGGVGVRGVVGNDLLLVPARSESLRMGLVSVAEAVWEVLMDWEVCTRSSSSRRRIPTRSRRVGCGAKFRRIFQ
jgi:sulfite reductase beta subunit-like hemoprotein